ncbi:hypothetical protein [Nonomuraea sp. NPDC049504]|jgi:hypothetical protein|uniref:hypothetical protein n=1 Tax=Nonomuraea sp. NPDC049504 TaxID=3154729 RepID=UPI003417AB2F
MKVADVGIAWTALYVASKITYALEGRLGVTGGPVVQPESNLSYGPGEVASAQWANAAFGVVVMAILLAGRLRLGRARARWAHVTVVTGHWLCGLMAAAGAVGMVGGALFTNRGGAVFGLYCGVWGALIALSARDLRRRPEQTTAATAAGRANQDA